MRDYALETTFDLKFTTRKFSTGAPFALASGVISAYPGNSTTQLTAGITLTADFDGVTGLNNVRVVATAANGYATNTNYALVITTGTVDSVSVVGEVIGEFSLEAQSPLRPTTAGRTLVVDAAGLADGNVVKVGPTGSGTAQTAGDLKASLNTIDDFIDTEITTLQTSVDDLPTNAELATALGTADDAVLAAIAALNNLSQANIRTAVGLGSANLDTQLDALPTAVELATALGTADDAVLAAIAALNNLSQANIRTAVGLGAANLDTQLDALPTAAENKVAVFTGIVEAAGSITLQEGMSILLAVAAGVTAAGGATLKTPDGSATRVAATINGSNERTAMTLTPSA